MRSCHLTAVSCEKLSSDREERKAKRESHYASAEKREVDANSGINDR